MIYSYFFLKQERQLQNWQLRKQLESFGQSNPKS